MKTNVFKFSLLLLLLTSCSSNSEHVHNFSNEWSFDDHYHWHECTDSKCDSVKDKDSHNLKDIEEDGHYYSSCECGYKVHRHVFSDEYKYDNEYHWKECLDPSCEEIKVKALHRLKHVNEDIVEYDICEKCGMKINQKERVDFEFENMKDEYDLISYNPYCYITSNYEDRVQYLKVMDEASQPVTISWGLDKGATSLKLYYGLKEDFSDAKEVELGSDITSYELFNLFKASTYYIKLVETIGESSKTIISSFKTSSIGPRPIVVDGIKNVRDIGGYEVNGKLTNQGMIYRGGQLSPDVNWYNYSLTEKGKETMSKELNIKTEIDLRPASESKTPLLESLIPGCNLLYNVTDGYKINAFKKQFKEIFTVLSKPSSYPVYFHCTGGADRTGTLAYMINAFLGVQELDLIHDYEFTSFSPYDIRCVSQGTYSGTNYWVNFMNELKSYQGSTLQEKATNYLLSTGLTQTQLDDIKKIMNA